MVVLERLGPLPLTCGDEEDSVSGGWALKEEMRTQHQIEAVKCRAFPQLSVPGLTQCGREAAEGERVCARGAEALEACTRVW